MDRARQILEGTLDPDVARAQFRAEIIVLAEAERKETGGDQAR